MLTSSSNASFSSMDLPIWQTLEALHIGKTVKAVLDSDLQAELSARSLYAEASDPIAIRSKITRREICLSNSCTMRKSTSIFLETQIELVARIGP